MLDWQEYIYKTSKAQEIKPKLDKYDCIKIKFLTLAKTERKGV